MLHTENGFLQLEGSIRIRLEATLTSPVQHALRMLTRDMETVLGAKPQLVEGADEHADISIRYAGKEESLQRSEAFGFRFPTADAMDIVGGDELGLVYGMLEFSKRFLGIQPFWCWMDQTIDCKDQIVIPRMPYDSPARKVRYRGWFVNDEVCLIGWKKPYPPSREVWEPVFEALLRCGGNMVIPGTDLPRDGVHYEVAAEMGLWVTHHHAEPLGAEMFLRAYPGRQASYQQHPELFEALWEEAIREQKDKKVVWVLSFRGQGDQPFWEQDQAFDTPEKRGAMIGRVVRKQYDMIRNTVPDPVCSVALYGEIAELYKGGYIDLPTDIIKIRADNGYGKMVSRRHGNLNYRVPSLPSEEDGGKHGVYYHVTFHDLQASNHLTLFPGPASFLKEELEAAFDAGAEEYLLVNCGNIRPHVYALDLVRELWSAEDTDVDVHLKGFVQNYYSESHSELAALYRSYADAAIPYGRHPDDWAGDEYYHHPARKIIGHWLSGRGEQADTRLKWAAGEESFPDQVRQFREHLEAGMTKWADWLAKCEAVIAKLKADDARRAGDHLRFHGILHLTGCEGFYWLCRSYEAYREDRFPQAFVHASQSLWKYSESLDVLRQAEHGKWENFYRADWLTNIECTMNNVDTLRRFIRIQGDSPDFFLWYKEFLMPESEKHIYLENTHRNPLSDDKLASLLKEYFERTKTL